MHNDIDLWDFSAARRKFKKDEIALNFSACVFVEYVTDFRR